MTQPTVFETLNAVLPDQANQTIPSSNSNNISYPLVGNPKDYPVKMQFLARRYEMKALLRAQHMNPDPNDETNLAAITLPLCVELTNNTSANYNEQIYSTRFGITDPTPAEIAEDVFTGTGVGGKAIGLLDNFSLEEFFRTFQRDVYYNFVRDKLGISEFNGEVPMDLRDAIYNSMQFRAHVFSWLFIPKNTAEALRVAKICNMFNTFVHPMRNTTVQMASRAIHPAMWNISVYDEDGTQGNRNRWIPYPQLSVLQQVQIRTRQSETGPWTLATSNPEDGNGHWPAATQLGLTFIELEPNIAVGIGENAKIISRSGYLSNTGLQDANTVQIPFRPNPVYNDTQGEL